MTPERLRQVRGPGAGMVFQDPMTSLNPVLTVGRQIAEGMRAHRRPLQAGGPRAGPPSCSAEVGLPDPERALDRYPHELSGGMRQRVVIAIALSNSPALLIADEATTALDVTVQAQIIDLVEKLQADHGTGGHLDHPRPRRRRRDRRPGAGHVRRPLRRGRHGRRRPGAPGPPVHARPARLAARPRGASRPRRRAARPDHRARPAAGAHGPARRLRVLAALPGAGRRRGARPSSRRWSRDRPAPRTRLPHRAGDVVRAA